MKGQGHRVVGRNLQGVVDVADAIRSAVGGRSDSVLVISVRSYMNRNVVVCPTRPIHDHRMVETSLNGPKPS